MLCDWLCRVYSTYQPSDHDFPVTHVIVVSSEGDLRPAGGDNDELKTDEAS